MQAWLQAMHGFTGRPSRARATSSASARNGRAIETRSTSVSAQQPLRGVQPATRLPAITGSVADRRLDRLRPGDQTPRRHRRPARSARGDSCQPTPMFSASAPAPRAPRRTASTSSSVVDPGIRSSPGHAEDHRERRADRRAHRPRELRRRSASAPFGVPAPVVVAPVGQRREELVDQVALRAHDLHRVEAEPPARGAPRGERRRSRRRSPRRPARAASPGRTGWPPPTARPAAGRRHSLDA